MVGIADLCLTTNGAQLAAHAAALRRAGLGRVTVSLDTLRADRHLAITRRDNHASVLAGIASLAEAGFANTKLNTVVIRGVNDDEVSDIVDFAQGVGAEPRFIEYMDVGGATSWKSELVVSSEELLARLDTDHGPVSPVPSSPSAPARRYRDADGARFRDCGVHDRALLRRVRPQPCYRGRRVVPLPLRDVGHRSAHSGARRRRRRGVRRGRRSMGR